MTASTSSALRPNAYPTHARTALSVVLLAFLYLWVFPYYAAINNPNENVRVYMTVAIVDDHTFGINRVERDWGYVNDKSIRNGILYSSKAPGTSYLGVPGYWLLTKISGRNTLPLTPAQVHAHHKPPLSRTTVIYFLRLWSNVLPALLFGYFFHRFLGKNTRSPALREAVFFSTMLGTQLYAYSEVFASHAHNAFAVMGALMAIAVVRERDRVARAAKREEGWNLGLMALTGLLGAAATMFEYPAAIGTAGVVILILATGAERRKLALLAAVPLVALAAKFAIDHKKIPAAVMALLAVVAYAATLTPRSLVRLVAAGIGSIPPTALVMLYHKRCFGDPFKPGYSYLENPEFRSQTNQGFFGTTAFSWEAATRLWLDPSFGLVASTAIYLAAIAGFGAYFSWRPPKKFVWPVRVASIGVVCFAAAKCVLAVIAIKAANWQGAGVDQAVWVAWLLVSFMLLASVTLPKPVLPDALFGASMLIVCFVLSKLIGTMNNWRGGWTVGPRYLATLEPLVAVAALVGLEAIAARGPAWRRATTVFAGGAAVQSFLMSAVPSAWFPHVPTEFVSPFFELFVPLVRDGYAPRNAGWYFFEWQGMRGMIPFFVVGAIITAIVLRGDERKPLAIGAHVLGAAAVALLLVAPFAAAAKYESMGVTRFVKSVWEPQPPAPTPPRATATHAAPAIESPAAMRERARRMAATGDEHGAFDLYRRAAAAR